MSRQGRWRMKGTKVAAVLRLAILGTLSQHFDRMVECRDTDGDSLFDLGVENRTLFPTDQPVKTLDLNRPWYRDGPIEQEVTSDAAWVNFTVTASGVPYRFVYNETSRLWRPALPSDGVLDRISLTFRLHATAHDV